MRLSDRIAQLEAASMRPEARPDGLAALAKLEAVLDAMGIEPPPADAPATCSRAELRAMLLEGCHEPT